MIKKRVLFICAHNSARSQMAEELLRKSAGDRFEVESAGLEPGKLNPNVVKVLREDEGIDISDKETKAAFDQLKQGKRYSYVITVCDETSAEKCPVFPGAKEYIHWSFPDPSGFTGTQEQVIEMVRDVKDRIKNRVEEFIMKDPLPSG